MRRGFTLIELILTMSIVIGLAVLSTGWYSRLLTQNAAANTANIIVGQLRKAQTYAVSNRGDSSWGVAYAAGVVTLYKGSSWASRDSAFNEAHTVNPTVSVTGMTDINFYKPTGLPATTATVVVSGNNIVKTITVNSQGGISL